MSLFRWNLAVLLVCAVAVSQGCGDAGPPRGTEQGKESSQPNSAPSGPDTDPIKKYEEFGLLDESPDDVNPDELEWSKSAEELAHQQIREIRERAAGYDPAAEPAGIPVELPATFDLSLPVTEYIQQGLPAHDRMWTGTDMARAAKVLYGIAREDLLRLPRYGSERSGPVFARIVSPETFAFLRNRSLPLEERMAQAIEYQGSLNEVLKLYLQMIAARGAGRREAVELAGAFLRSFVVLFEIVDEFAQTLDPNDPTYPSRMQGLEKMKRGTATVVAGNLEMLTERDLYTTEELQSLLSYLQESLPILLPRLPSGARVETLVRLRQMAKDPEMHDLKPGLTLLLGKLQKHAIESDTP
jgi:hypothetical protein